MLGFCSGLAGQFHPEPTHRGVDHEGDSGGENEIYMYIYFRIWKHKEIITVIGDEKMYRLNSKTYCSLINVFKKYSKYFNVICDGFAVARQDSFIQNQRTEVSTMRGIQGERVDKTLLRNLLLGYLTSSAEQRQQVFRRNFSCIFFL